MYGYEWTESNGIFRLTIDAHIEKEIRPVFKEELDFFGMNAYWDYPDTDKPLLWAEGIRRYVVNGEVVAEAKEGGYYTKPKIKIHRKGLTLTPISVEDLWKENAALLTGMEQRAITFIQKTYTEYAAKGYSFVVAFSGGKDSLLLLDLVAKALPPENFYVVFSNTGMELDETLHTIEKAKRHWPNLRFEEAKCHMDPLQSWDEFGPPGRRLRWCCAVHKSVPTILKLRELTGQYDVQAVVYDGVRAEESARRAKYDEISVGAKNINQVNCSPILKWNTAELFVYLLHNNIYLNDAYRYGLFRMGCKVCPMSSAWWDGITNILYPQEMAPLLHKVEAYAIESKPEAERHKFIESGGWKARMGGRGLPNGGNRITESVSNDTLTFSFASHTQNWWDVAPVLGPIIEKNEARAVQLIDRREYTVSVDDTNGLVVKVAPFSMMDRLYSAICAVWPIKWRTASAAKRVWCSVRLPPLKSRRKAVF